MTTERNTSFYALQRVSQKPRPNSHSLKLNYWKKDRRDWRPVRLRLDSLLNTRSRGSTNRLLTMRQDVKSVVCEALYLHALPLTIWWPTSETETSERSMMRLWKSTRPID